MDLLQQGGAEDGPRGINFSAVDGAHAEDQFSSGSSEGPLFSCDKTLLPWERVGVWMLD